MTPTADTYSGASGQLIYAGPMPWPAWRTAMAANTWAAIPATNTIAAINPANSLTHNPGGGWPIWAGSGGQAQVVSGWSGAVFDAETDTLAVFGGGHGDYGGNEVYKVRLDTTAPAWSMVAPPSGAGISSPAGNLLTKTTGDLSSDGTYFDGKIRSQHTRNKIDYVPGFGLVVGRNSGGYPAVTADDCAWAVDLDTGAHTKLSNAQAYSDTVAAVYDSLRNRIWTIIPGASNLRHVDLSASAPRAYPTVTGTNYVSAGSHWDAGAEYIAQHDLIAVCGGRQAPEAYVSGLTLYDPAQNRWHTPTMTGIDLSGILHNWGHARPHWVPGIGLCLWDNAAGHEAKIVVLAPTGNIRTDPWIASVILPHASNAVTPTARQANGTYGRFAYSPRLNGFYLTNSVSGPVYFYALV